MHGKGVFALMNIADEELICEYKGQRLKRQDAMRRPPRNLLQPDHTFLFDVGDGYVIDGSVGGNSARWINHSCEPNCVPEEHKGRIYIRAARNIAKGQELSIDYALTGKRPTKRLARRYACNCNAKRCRGTMLAGQGSR